MRSGWCAAAPGARPKCRECRAASCSCRCHAEPTHPTPSHGISPRICQEKHETESVSEESDA